MDMFEGPDRNKNIMIIVGAIVLAMLIFFYATRLSGILGSSTEATPVGGPVFLDPFHETATANIVPVFQEI